VLTELGVRTLLFAGLVGLAFAPLERVLGARRGARSARTTDLAFATLGQLVVALGVVFGVGGVLAHLEALGPDRPVLGFVEPPAMRGVLHVLLGLVLFDLAGYAYHRLAHRIPWMWRLHRVHHSAERMDWLASFRQHPVEILLVTLVQNVPLVILGIPLGAHAGVLLFLRVHTVFVHADLELPDGWWSRVLAMPAFHHRHHDRLGAPRNFAALLPAIDRCFGTASAQRTDDVGLSGGSPRGFAALLLWPLGAGARYRDGSR
jgi:sterol desaturase/sphingolipid hydroxylase (fatty acid hydroxylase superfamily)